MQAEAQRASEVVRRLRDFFREGTTRLERVALAELLESVRKQAKTDVLTIESEQGLPDVLVDRLQIELVLRNLVNNAAEALDGAAGKGVIALSAQRHDAQHVRIVVADNGPGVPAANRERVFEPFVSGQADRHGARARGQPCDRRGARRHARGDARAARRVPARAAGGAANG